MSKRIKPQSLRSQLVRDVFAASLRNLPARKMDGTIMSLILSEKEPGKPAPLKIVEKVS